MHNAAESLFCPPEHLGAFGAEAWVSSLLRIEAALASAQGELGMIPAEAAGRITLLCTTPFDAAAIERAGAANASMAVPLVAALKAKALPQDRAFIHLGATSQDLLDTAQALLSQPVLASLEQHGRGLLHGLRALANTHARTPMLARTLLQNASITSFGFVCAGWAGAVWRGLQAIQRAKPSALRLQLAGAAGTQAQLRAASQNPHAAQAVRKHMAQALGLTEPSDWPTHTQRDEWLTLAAVVAVFTGSLGKIATDLALLSQFELGEVGFESTGGASSAMPHKRNPVALAVAKGAALRAPHQIASMLACMAQEHQRALGAWQAELAAWPALLCGAAASVQALAQSVASLQVQPSAMLRNINAMRCAVDQETADTWFEPNLANDAGEQTLQLMEALDK